MKHLLIILSLFLFSFTVISCSDEKEDSTENSGTTTTTTTTTDDTTKFVGVGNSGTIVRSTDNGSSFDNATSPTGNHLYGVGHGNNIFVAVGSSGNILRSTDNGTTWDNATSPTENQLTGVTF